MSEDAVDVSLAGETIRFAAGETIHTESCYKYGPRGVADLAERCELRYTWTDDADRFGVQYLEVPR